MTDHLFFIFDFDHTIIRDNSDTYIPLQLNSPTAKNMLDNYKSDPPWNQFMDMIIMAAQKQDGATISDIIKVATTMPYFPELLECLRECAKLGSLYIVSDANDVYISSFLQHHQLHTLVKEVHTNPTRIDENGFLRVLPYHSSTCKLCTLNMCKGIILEQILMKSNTSQTTVSHNNPSTSQQRRIVYVGDGRGDLHPATLLSESDIVCVRYDITEPRALGLYKIISKSPETIKAQIIYWKDGQELLMALKNIFKF
jgi:pyridoxal phosphate phosphatase PHOSPHO2